MIKKAQAGTSISKKPAPKKPMAPTPKKKKSYPILSDDGENYNGPKVGPREKTPGGGFSRNGSKIKMQMGGSAESNKFTIPSKNKISIPKKTSKDSSVESNVFTIPSRNKISIPKKGAMMKKGGTMKKCKYGCK